LAERRSASALARRKQHQRNLVERMQLFFAGAVSIGAVQRLYHPAELVVFLVRGRRCKWLIVISLDEKLRGVGDEQQCGGIFRLARHTGARCTRTGVIGAYACSLFIHAFGEIVEHHALLPESNCGRSAMPPSLPDRANGFVRRLSASSGTSWTGFAGADVKVKGWRARKCTASISSSILATISETTARSGKELENMALLSLSTS